MSSAIHLPDEPVRRERVSSRSLHGDRVAADRRAVAVAEIHSLTQGTRRSFTLTATLTAQGRTELQLFGSLRDLELFAGALNMALADARHVAPRRPLDTP